MNPFLRHPSFLILAALLAADAGGIEPPQYNSPAELGQALFADPNLSAKRTQSCANCHAPSHGFIDPRSTSVGGAVSLGDDGRSLGTRNTPTLSYASLTPTFGLGPDGSLRGGFFHDGRAATLAEQAQEPLLNPIEMALTDADMLRARIGENPGYVDALHTLFGIDLAGSAEAVMNAVAESIAAFEQTRQFSPFDSKYDRHLRGEVELSRLEERGRLLFFSKLVNCASCHWLNQPARETFTDYTFHNIGVPRNPQLGPVVDRGLAANKKADPDSDRGKFKVPTLRNVAITAPYMHNGVFKDLRTVLVFYNTFTLRTPINPETQAPWGEPEVAENISHDLLREGQPLNEPHIEALLAFMRALTDKRFEFLLE